MEDNTVVTSNSLSIIILRILRIGIAADVIIYATYNLGPRLKAISNDFEPFGIECPWYGKILIQFSDIIVIYTAQCFVITVLLSGFYLYAEFKLASHSPAVCVALRVLELVLLTTAIALLLAWGFGLESMLIHYIMLKGFEVS